jgi:hypothetical protein
MSGMKRLCERTLVTKIGVLNLLKQRTNDGQLLFVVVSQQSAAEFRVLSAVHTTHHIINEFKLTPQQGAVRRQW